MAVLLQTSRSNDSWRLRWAMARLLASRPGEVPSRAVLLALRNGWGANATVPDVDFLEEVARRAAVTSGPVLECGSGLTTLILAAVAGRRGVEIWSLEHDWTRQLRVARALRRFALVANVCRAPLRDYGSFHWYDPPEDQIPPMIRLVICDGRPDVTTGGCYGLLPVLRERLTEHTVIVLGQASREHAFSALCRWTTEAPIQVRMREHGASSLALIRNRSA